MEFIPRVLLFIAVAMLGGFVVVVLDGDFLGASGVFGLEGPVGAGDFGAGDFGGLFLGL